MIIIISILTSLLSYYIGQKLDVIRGSIIATLAVGSVSYLFFPLTIDTNLFIIYGASFIGMTSDSVHCYRKIIISSIIYSFIFQSLAMSLPKVGGSLGFMAFISVSVTYMLSLFAQSIKKT